MMLNAYHPKTYIETLAAFVEEGAGAAEAEEAATMAVVEAQGAMVIPRPGRAEICISNK